MEELKTKCETIIADLEAVKATCTENGRITDVRAGTMHHKIATAINGLKGVISTIDTYYANR